MDIVIYTNKETLLHKQGKGELDFGDEYYWHLSKFPKRLELFDRIYFATNKYVQGSFLISELNPGDEETIFWNKNSWKPVEQSTPTTQFRGFRYRWWK